ncbi:hypothetical protein CspeluHIS016_0402870 [Cutaneotrichosporon spelunceum]|uniref:Uncharacterized protein n=1 Tax=Cutaneotrichosporon spelunceum TaxID=1672016 RepID=A0AAD3TVK9_9TREE|nr:hypothetical protein CspeluHIS016_0402870 [Cutaneotrichosporon spelunceum]
MPMLDTPAYPHLLDAIISHSSPPALQSLAHTCRTLYTRLIPRLYRHVTLRTSRFRGEIVSALPPFTHLRTLRPCSEPPSHLSYTHILDLCAAYGYGRPQAFPSLRIIRHPLAYRTWPMPRFLLPKHPVSGRLPPRIVSNGGEWMPPERWERVQDGVYIAYLHLTHARWHEEHDVPGLYIGPPEGTRRLVLRLAWDPAYPRVRYADIVFGEVAMHADIVVVFEPVCVDPSQAKHVVAKSVAGYGTGESGDRTGVSSRRRRRSLSRSPSPSRPAKRARRPSTSSPPPVHTGHAHAPTTTESEMPDTYHDPLRAHGLFGSLCYALMNRAIEQGVAVCFVGVDACMRHELFLPPTEPSGAEPSREEPSARFQEDKGDSEDEEDGVGKGDKGNTGKEGREDTVAAARIMLETILDSVLVLPEEFGWDCMTAWQSMACGERWFDGQVATGLRRHFRFESAETWRSEGEGGQLRALESGNIAWEENEERVRAAAGVTEGIVPRFA